MIMRWKGRGGSRAPSLIRPAMGVEQPAYASLIAVLFIVPPVRRWHLILPVLPLGQLAPAHSVQKRFDCLRNICS